MKTRKNLIIGIFIISAVIAFDTVAQAWIFSAIQEAGKPITITPFFNFVEVWNHGISFGMFNKLAYGQWILSLFALGISVFLTRLLLRADNSFEAVAYSLMIGGAVGNVIDRILSGAVADYLDFHAFGYHWPAFNVTDSAVFTGVALLLISLGKRTRGVVTD